MKTQSQEELRPQVLAKMAFGHSSAITAWNREPTKTNYHTLQLTPSKINAPSLESATKLPIHNLGRNKRRPIYGPSTANSHSPFQSLSKHLGTKTNRIRTDRFDIFDVGGQVKEVAIFDAQKLAPFVVPPHNGPHFVFEKKDVERGKWIEKFAPGFEPARKRTGPAKITYTNNPTPSSLTSVCPKRN